MRTKDGGTRVGKAVLLATKIVPHLPSSIDVAVGGVGHVPGENTVHFESYRR